MNKSPFFSIIIPALNESNDLPNLLTDLSKQIFQDFEVIVVDGRSEDDTVKRALKFKKLLPSLTIFASKKRNVSCQRNLGAKKARAKTLMFIDADCRIKPEFLLGVSYRWLVSQVDILSFYLKPDEPGKRNETIATALNLFFEMQYNFKMNYLLEALFVIDRKCFQVVGGFDESRSFDEGHQLLKMANGLGYQSKIVRDPQYTFSFRRLRRFGLLNTTGNIAKIELARLIGKKDFYTLADKYYPMNGGGQFNYPEPAANRFIAKISKLVKYIRQAV